MVPLSSIQFEFIKYYLAKTVNIKCLEYLFCTPKVLLRTCNLHNNLTTLNYVLV